VVLDRAVPIGGLDTNHLRNTFEAIFPVLGEWQLRARQTLLGDRPRRCRSLVPGRIYPIGFHDLIGYELEGQVAQHWGKQDHEEFNFAFTLRWLPFLWDKYLDTSFAFGNGLSIATAEPELEIREGDEHRTNPILYYILVELAFALPQQPQWNLFVRIHHRSSVFGLIENITTGSNFVGLGLRYKF
jgi:hypothetical protein